MECAKCGLEVRVVDGAVSAHLNPETLKSCDGKAEEKAEEKAPPKKAGK